MSCSLHWRLTEQGLCVGASKDVGTSVLLMLYMLYFFFFFLIIVPYFRIERHAVYLILLHHV